MTSAITRFYVAFMLCSRSARYAYDVRLFSALCFLTFLSLGIPSVSFAFDVPLSHTPTPLTLNVCHLSILPAFTLLDQMCFDRLESEPVAIHRSLSVIRHTRNKAIERTLSERVNSDL